jgi:ornithine cyclodeaminase
LATVPRDTASFLAKVATLLRAFWRSRAMSCRSVVSMPQCDSWRCCFARKLLFMQQVCRFSLAGIAKTIGDWPVHPHPPPIQSQPMTTLLTPQDIAHIVATHGLPTVLRELVAATEAAFLRWPSFDKVPRVASHTERGVIELMPTADSQHYSFKYVNGHPGNAALGLPTVMAFGVLADVATGLPTLVSELTLTTALRTAATSVMAAKRLARPVDAGSAGSMALIGNGAQAEFQALAFHHLLGVHTLRLFDVDPAATAKLQRNLAGMPGLKLVVCSSTAQAVQGAGIVTTITADKRNATIITPCMVQAGTHFNAVGGDCPGKTELHPGVLQAARVFVEFEPQTRVEGDLQQMPAHFAVTELWRVLAGLAPGRVSPHEVTVFDSVGFALEDFAALQLVGRWARELGLGQAVHLIPALADPKDLFGGLLGPTHLAAAPVASAAGRVRTRPQFAHQTPASCRSAAAIRSAA